MNRKTGFVVFLVLLLIVFLIQNSDATLIKFLFFEADISKSLVILVTAILGLLIGFVGGRLSEDSDGDKDKSKNDTALPPSAEV